MYLGEHPKIHGNQLREKFFFAVFSIFFHNDKSFHACRMAKARNGTCGLPLNTCLRHFYLEARVFDILHTVKVEVVAEGHHKVDGVVPGVSAHLDGDCLLDGCLVREHRQSPEVTNHKETHVIS